MNNGKSIPLTAILLIILVGFQAISGISGGLCLVMKPSGELLQMPVSMLAHSPFRNFLVPGLCLLILLGLLPGFAFIGLFRKSAFKWMNWLNLYRNRHWSWCVSLYTGVMLIFWIDVEVWIIGYGSALQAIYASTGLLIMVSGLMPATIRYYKLSKHER